MKNLKARNKVIRGVEEEDGDGPGEEHEDGFREDVDDGGIHQGGDVTADVDV